MTRHTDKQRKARAAMTPKQRVLKKYPNAHAHLWAGPAWVIYTGEYVNRAINEGGRSPQQAWAEAARRL